jgi:hypothetical protein
MRIGDVLYFSPAYKFSELDFDDARPLLQAVQDRVEGFYLAPAERSLKAGDAFAGGLICCASIEFIATLSGKEDPEAWITNNIADFGNDGRLASRFWDYFRHGLAHEGRIKSNGDVSGQFSLELPRIVTSAGGVLIVNPQLLLNAVRAAFQTYCKDIDEGKAASLAKYLRRLFQREVTAAKS